MSRNQKGRIKGSAISGLPKEKTFIVNFLSKEEGIRYQGSFTVKRPNMMQSLEMEGVKSTILGGKYYDPRNPGCGIPPMIAMMAEMMSFLQVCVTDAPDWWEGGEGDFSDPGLIYEIYKEAQEVDPFRERIEFLVKEAGGEETEDSVGDGGGAGHREPDQSDAPGGLAEMVDQQV